MPALFTDRLQLVPITLAVIENVLRRNRSAAEQALDNVIAECGIPFRGPAAFPEAWPNDELVARAFPYSLEAIRAAPEIRLWGDSLVLPRDGSPRVLGSVVFKGRPDDGIAEIGYGVEDSSRGQGLATEATRACIEWALEQPGIIAVHATTFPWHHASLAVIRKCGLSPCGVRDHDIFGELLVFERKK